MAWDAGMQPRNSRPHAHLPIERTGWVWASGAARGGTRQVTVSGANSLRTSRSLVASAHAHSVGEPWSAKAT
jgi:hypothetical protein